MSHRIAESPRPVSESGIWDLLARFYRERGLEIWQSGGVPQRVTSQGYLADSYAAVIAAFERDIRRAGSSEPPLIVEVGGGSGLSAWVLMNRLMRHHTWDGRPPEFDYLLTETNLEHARAWAQVPRLRRLVDEGPLHLGVLDIDGPVPSEVTSLAGTRLDLTGRPLVLVANYVMDSLPADLYRVRDGRLLKEFVKIEGEPEVEGGSATLAGLTLEYESREIEAPDTGHRTVDEILEGYRHLSGDLCIPVSMPFVSFLEPFLQSHAPFVMLAGDLAYTTTDFGTEPPLVHDKYIACNANFHLIGQLFERLGGTTVFARHADVVFSSGAFIRPTRGVDLLGTREAAQVALSHFGPHDALNIEQALSTHDGPLDFSMLTAWARLARYDAYTTDLCLPHLMGIIEAGEPYEPEVLWDLLLESFRLELPEVTDEDSLAPKIAFLFFRAGMHREVVGFLDLAWSEVERTSECLHMYAVSQARLGKTDRALALLADIGVSTSDYWSGWPTEDGAPANVDRAALLEKEDSVHCDHIVLRLSVEEFRRMGTDTAGTDD